MKVVYLICLLLGLWGTSCVVGDGKTQDAYQFRFYPTGDDESPNALWLVGGLNKKILQIDKGDRIEVVEHSWNARHTAAALNIVRGTKVASLLFIGRFKDGFRKIDYEDADLYRIANGVAVASKESWDNMDVEYVLGGWEGESIFRYQVEMQNEESGKFIFHCKINVGSSSPKVAIEKISR